MKEKREEQKSQENAKGQESVMIDVETQRPLQEPFLQFVVTKKSEKLFEKMNNVRKIKIEEKRVKLDEK